MEIVEGGLRPTMITLEDLTSGQLTYSGGAIRLAETGRIVQPVIDAYPATIAVSPTGFITFTREAPLSRMNQPTASASRYGVIGDALVTMPNGEERAVAINSWLTGPGQRVIVLNDSVRGDADRFRMIDLFNPAGERIDPQLPNGWRYATAQEAHDRAILGFLLKDEETSRMIKEAMNLGIENADGEPITNYYEAGEWLEAKLDTTPGLTALLME